MEQSVKEALLRINDITSTNKDRQDAFTFLEELKEPRNLSLSIGIGISFTCRGENNSVRHFGLQLLEHGVKFGWYEMNVDEKCKVKDGCQDLINNGTFSILEELPYIKDGLSRIMVEMIKREWPQQWPSLMEELSTMCLNGAIQTEIVLLILLRLAEDTVIFQVVPQNRSKELASALNENTTAIFTFMVSKLKESVMQMNEHIEHVDQTEFQVPCRLAQCVLQTFTGYAEWVSSSYFTQGEEKLLGVICKLLENKYLRNLACEVLLLIVNKKGPLENMKHLLILFNQGAIEAILTVVQYAHLNIETKNDYFFLKNCVQLLTRMGSLLASVWQGDSDVTEPSSFRMYLEAIMFFSKHPSKMINSYCINLWLTFIKHDIIKKSETFRSFLHGINDAIKIALHKVNFPIHPDNISSEYSMIDFENSDDCKEFFSSLRHSVSNYIRLVTDACPLETFLFSHQWTLETLSRYMSESHDAVNLYSFWFLEWDALSVFLENVTSSISKNTSLLTESPFKEKGIEMLERLLEFNFSDPLILSSALSCINALTLYISYKPCFLPLVLDRIFTTAVFNQNNEMKAKRSTSVRCVRRHACSSFINLCKSQPGLLLPGFNQLYKSINSLNADPLEFSQLEILTLYEALVILSNNFKNYDQQSVLIGEILNPVKIMWSSHAMKEALWNPCKFMEYIGLCEAPVEPSEGDVCGINRANICKCVNDALSIMKRSNWPLNEIEAQNGGFVKNIANRKCYMNPCMDHINVMLENMLALIRTINMLWLPEHAEKRHGEFLKCFEVVLHEKQNILGLQLASKKTSGDCEAVPTGKNPIERMQFFLFDIYDKCHQFLGNMGECLGYSFYSSTNLIPVFLQSVLKLNKCIPPYRLRSILKHFLKPYIQSCPKELRSSKVLPLLEVLFPFLFEYLNDKWSLIQSRFEGKEANCRNDDDDDDNESQEVLEEQYVRILSRDYFDLILFTMKESSYTENGFKNEDDMSDDTNVKQNLEFVMSDIGKAMLANDIFANILYCNICYGMTWLDTLTSARCSQILLHSMKQVAVSKSIKEEEVSLIFSSILRAINIHGEHDSLLSTLLGNAVQMYEILRPLFPDMIKLFSLIPNCNEQNVLSFDKLFLQNSPHKSIPFKKKKDSFKRIIDDIIGTNIGQVHKRHVTINTLPPLPQKIKRCDVIDEIQNEDAGLCLLFS